MNHFEAVNEMRQLASARGLVEIEIEIDWQGTVCEGGHNVEGRFTAPDSREVVMFWDAAFQKMTIL